METRSLFFAAIQSDRFCFDSLRTFLTFEKKKSMLCGMNRMQFDSLLTTIVLTHRHTRMFGVCDVGGGVAGGGGGVGKTARSWSFTVRRGKKNDRGCNIQFSFLARALINSNCISLASIQIVFFFQIKISFDFQDYEHLPIIFNKLYYIKAKQKKQQQIA